MINISAQAFNSFNLPDARLPIKLCLPPESTGK
jgi:hypothetical protein